MKNLARMRLRTALSVALVLVTGICHATTYSVATTGNDTNPGTLSSPFQTIQKGLSKAQPGDVVSVRGGIYQVATMVTFPRSGNTTAGYITLQPYNGEHPVIDGTTLNRSFTKALVLMENRAYIRFTGFEVTNFNYINTGAAAVMVSGGSDHIEISRNTIHNVGKNGTSLRNVYIGEMRAIGVYSTQNKYTSNVTVDRNTLYDVTVGDANVVEAVGNVAYFSITNNTCYHCTANVVIYAAGGYVNNTSLYPAKPYGTATNQIQSPADRRAFLGGTTTDYTYLNGAYQIIDVGPATQGTIRGNTVYNNFTTPLGGTGIDIDGATDTTVERNICHDNDTGIVVNSEIPGAAGDHITVQNNLLYNNVNAGLRVGNDGRVDPNTGDIPGTGGGATTNCVFRNNTVYHNGTLPNSTTGDPGSYNLVVGNSVNCSLYNNLFVSRGEEAISNTGAASDGLQLDYNLFYTPSGSVTKVQFNPNRTTYYGFANYRAGFLQDAHSQYAAPLFTVAPSDGTNFQPASPDDFPLAMGSPALGAGSSVAGQYAPTDFTGAVRQLPPSPGIF